MANCSLPGATRVAGLLTLALMVVTGSMSAQDVVQEGLRHGVQPPPSLLADLQADPGRFEFQRAWIQKLESVRANRTALEATQGPFLTDAQIAASHAAMTGELKVPVVGALYSDQTSASYADSLYQDKLFGEGDPGTIGYTVRNFYKELSRNAFAVGGSVPTWPTLPQNAEYYRPSDATHPVYGRTADFLKDALDLMDPGLDFGLYDNDGPDGIPNSGDDDGYVDVVAFLYEDAARSCGGPGIWPHRWMYGGWPEHGMQPYITNDSISGGGANIKVWDYMIQAGLGCDGTSLMEIGTFAHELGHALGLPDLYDTDGSDGASAGIGEWGLMGSGNWNRPDSPAHMGAWSKDRMGWVSVAPITASVSGHTMPPVYDAGHVMRYNLPGAAGEYFLLEHRAQTGSDQHLHGPGLLVWHIDSTVSGNGNELQKRVDLEEADGQYDLDNNDNRGDAGDPFPGSVANSAFNATSNPDSKNNAGTGSEFALSNIAMNASALTFDIVVSDIVASDSIAAWIDSVVVKQGAAITLPVRVDMSEVGKAIGSIQARITFDTAVVSFVSMTSDFEGMFSPNLDSVSSGIVRFAGINTSSSANLDTTKVAILNLLAKDRWNSQTVVDLDIPELTQSDFTNVTGEMNVIDGHVLVSPGTFTMAMRGEETVSKEESRPIALWAYVNELDAELGSIQGRFPIGNSVLVVDSVTAGDFGGTFDSNIAMQADSGFVRFAIVQLTPPAGDSAHLANVWVTAKDTTEGGDTATVGAVIEEIADPVQMSNLLPFLTSITPLHVTVSVGVWGDTNSDKLITALDALVCLSGVVGKDVSMFDPTGCDVAPDSGTEFIGTVTALDALAILSHVVGISLPATFRVGDNR